VRHLSRHLFFQHGPLSFLARGTLVVAAVGDSATLTGDLSLRAQPARGSPAESTILQFLFQENCKSKLFEMFVICESFTYVELLHHYK